MQNLVLVWIFSSVLAWAFAGSATQMGDTLGDPYFRKGVRLFALVVAFIALITTPAVSPAFVIAFGSLSTESFVAGASWGFLLWSFMHLGGALVSFIGNGRRLLTNTL